MFKKVATKLENSINQILWLLAFPSSDHGNDINGSHRDDSMVPIRALEAGLQIENIFGHMLIS